jgi:hypothetical protein
MKVRASLRRRLLFRPALRWFLVSLLFGCLLTIGSMAASSDATAYAENIAALIDPAKLVTLGQRGAIPRVEKYVAQLAEAQTTGLSPKRVATKAVSLAGMKGAAAAVTVETMMRNLRAAEGMNCLTPEGLQDMRRGYAPTIRRGPYKGDQLSVDHIIPLKVAPELDHVIANLELLPLKINEGKKAAIGQRQKDLKAVLRQR